MMQLEVMQKQAQAMARVAEEMTAAFVAEGERGAQQAMVLWRDNLDAMRGTLQQLAAADLRDPQAVMRAMSERQMKHAAHLQAEATGMLERNIAFQTRVSEILRNSTLELGAALPMQDAPAIGLTGRQVQDMMAGVGTTFADAWKQSMDAIRVNFERFEMPAANLPAIAPKARRTSGRAKAA